MKITFFIEGQAVDSFVAPFPLTFEKGQGYLLHDDAYVVTSVTKDSEDLRVDLEPQAFCDDCGMARVTPSDRPFCICDGPIE